MGRGYSVRGPFGGFIREQCAPGGAAVPREGLGERTIFGLARSLLLRHPRKRHKDVRQEAGGRKILTILLSSSSLPQPEKVSRRKQQLECFA